MRRTSDRSNSPPGSAANTGQRGFTLIEMLIVLLIAAIVAIITIPNLRRTAIKARSTSAIAQMVGPFNLARSEALKRRSPVGVWYRETDRLVTVFEDWDPNNADLLTNNDGALSSNEQTIGTIAFPKAVLADSGTEIDTVIYRTDGVLDTLKSVPQDAGVARLIDRAGNRFQLRVNGVTGSVTVEGQNKDGQWTTVKEAWEWKY